MEAHEEGSDPTMNAPIAYGAALQIARGFKMAVPDVIIDARQVAAWSGSGDDLLQWLERRHGVTAGGAVAYLMTLRAALRGKLNQEPPA
jgi:hypothetical protein